MKRLIFYVASIVLLVALFAFDANSNYPLTGLFDDGGDEKAQPSMTLDEAYEAGLVPDSHDSSCGCQPSTPEPTPNLMWTPTPELSWLNPMELSGNRVAHSLTVAESILVSE